LVKFIFKPKVIENASVYLHKTKEFKKLTFYEQLAFSDFDKKNTFIDSHDIRRMNYIILNMFSLNRKIKKSKKIFLIKRYAEKGHRYLGTCSN
jgi:hypothetical protein